MTEAEARGGHPVPAEGPQFSLNPRAMRLEAAATQGGGGKLGRFRARSLGEMLFAIVSGQDRTRRRALRPEALSRLGGQKLRLSQV